jgi:hypothetical protein
MNRGYFLCLSFLISLMFLVKRYSWFLVICEFCHDILIRSTNKVVKNCYLIDMTDSGNHYVFSGENEFDMIHFFQNNTPTRFSVRSNFCTVKKDDLGFLNLRKCLFPSCYLAETTKLVIFSIFPRSFYHSRVFKICPRYEF